MNRKVKSHGPFIKVHRTLLIWRRYWAPMMSVLSPPTNPGMPNSENCLLHSQFAFQILPLKELLYQQFGLLSESSIKTEEHSYTMRDSLGAESSFLNKSLVPQVITDINTEYGQNKLRSVSCLNDEDTCVWTCVENKSMKLYNLRGQLLNSVQTKEGNRPWDIAAIM